VRTAWVLIVLGLLLAACSLETKPAASATLTPGNEVSVTLPPSGAVYLTLKDAVDATRVYAAPLEAGSVRLVILNSDLMPMAASASHYWFGKPDVATFAIAVEPTTGPRLNFRAYPGYEYVVKVENHTGQELEAAVGAFSFTPRGQEDNYLTAGEVSGAIEFLAQMDTYEVLEDGTLTLSAGEMGKPFIVAHVYESALPGAAKLFTLEPGDSYPVKAGNFVVVQARGQATAGFDEPESFQYTLNLTVAVP